MPAETATCWSWPSSIPTPSPNPCWNLFLAEKRDKEAGWRAGPVSFREKSGQDRDAQGRRTKKDEKKPDFKAEHDRIVKENKRKQDEYDEQIAKGKARVKELNERFADWYYVISDDVYNKIHLTRNQAVRKKGRQGRPRAKPCTNMTTTSMATMNTAIMTTIMAMTKTAMITMTTITIMALPPPTSPPHREARWKT